MNGADANQMVAVFFIKSIHIRNVLEEVCKLLARFNRIVGCYVVGKLGNLERDIFLCEILCHQL